MSETSVATAVSRLRDQIKRKPQRRQTFEFFGIHCPRQTKSNANIA